MNGMNPSAVGRDLGPERWQVARAAVAERVEVARKSLCAMVALVEPGETLFYAHGQLAANDARSPDEHTVFELGCIVKVFDSLLLNEMVERGEVALSDPVQDYLPPDVKVPRSTQPITFQHLATHMSGLPGRQSSPASDRVYGSTANMLEFLSSYEMTREPGSFYEYSNLGAGLLRYALSVRTGLDYETLLRARICAPLGMDSTVFASSPEIKAHTAPGHGDRLQPAAGSPLELRSTAHDLGKFLRAMMGLDEVPQSLRTAMTRMLSIRVPSSSKVEAAMGWRIETHGVDEIVCHEGATDAFRAWLGYRPSVTTGIVILSNAATVGGFVDIGYHVLDDNYPLLTIDSPLIQPRNVPRAIPMPVELLARHIGEYQLTPNVSILILLEGDQLWAQKTEQGKVAIYPESPLEFFCEEVNFFSLPADTRITFQADSTGATTGMNLHQRGHSVWLPRATTEEQGVWFGHRPAFVNSAWLQRFVGSYHMGDMGLTVRREGAELIGEFDHDFTVQMVPESETKFFVMNDVMDVHLEFTLDDNREPVGLTGSFNGQLRQGSRVGYQRTKQELA